MGDLYFTVHSYPLNSIPLTGSCFTGDAQPTVTFTVSKGEGASNTVLQTKTYTDNYPQPIQVIESSYAAGDILFAAVDYTWNASPQPDFTIVVYSKQKNLQILDNTSRLPNTIHMDGNSPSGFTESTYRRSELLGNWQI